MNNDEIKFDNAWLWKNIKLMFMVLFMLGIFMFFAGLFGSIRWIKILGYCGYFFGTTLFVLIIIRVVRFFKEIIRKIENK
jgi:hypothetical protein